MYVGTNTTYRKASLQDISVQPEFVVTEPGHMIFFLLLFLQCHWKNIVYININLSRYPLKQTIHNNIINKLKKLKFQTCVLISPWLLHDWYFKYIELWSSIFILLNTFSFINNFTMSIHLQYHRRIISKATI